MMSLIAAIIVGLVAGWLASIVVKGRGYGMVGDTLIGLVGGLVGGLLFNFLGLDTTNIIGAVVVAFIGALILLGVTKVLKTV